MKQDPFCFSPRLTLKKLIAWTYNTDPQIDFIPGPFKQEAINYIDRKSQKSKPKIKDLSIEEFVSKINCS
jgi:hypothetical protein